MDAAGTSNCGSGTSAFELARLLRTAVALGMLLLALAGVMLVERRLAGALAAPPSSAMLWIVGMLLAGAGVGFRGLFLETTQPRRNSLAVMLVPSAVSTLWLAVLSLPETGGWGLILLIGPVLVAEGWSWGRLGQRDAPRLPVCAPLASPSANATPPIATPYYAAPPAVAVVASTVGVAERSETSPAADELANQAAQEVEAEEIDADLFSDESDEEFPEPAERDEHALQQQTRRRDEEAGEVVDGWVRVDFAAGQRHAAAHIAICPPMHGKPTCYAEPGEGPDASVKVTQAMSYGVRLEVKLDEAAAEPASVVVEYSILEHAAAGE